MFTVKRKSRSPRIASKRRKRVFTCYSYRSFQAQYTMTLAPTLDCTVALQTCSRLLGPESVSAKSGARRDKIDSNGGGGKGGSGRDGGGAGKEGENGGGGQRGNNGKFLATLRLGFCGKSMLPCFRTPLLPSSVGVFALCARLSPQRQNSA